MIPIEVNTCGFFTIAEARAYCAGSATRGDPCCARVIAAAATGPSTQVPGGAPPNPPTSNPPSPTADRTVITGLASGVGGVALLTVSVLALRKYRARRRSSDVSSKSMTQTVSRKPSGLTLIPTHRQDERVLNSTSSVSPSFPSPPNSAQYLLSSPISSSSSSARMGPPPQLPLPTIPSNARFSMDPTSAIYGSSPPQGSLAGTTITRSVAGDDQNTDIGQEQESVAASDGQEQPKTRMKVWAEYVPDLRDEIQLKVGDVMEIYETFPDGWATGQNLTTGTTGVFPLACLITPTSPLRGSITALSRLSGRVSSMVHGGGNREEDES
ncbi:uncharacterized protein SPPG_07747 [Spizellomyces punctatus DAOM BR117]|uniref:SH3 domain-containing protein n=1 Tax=Spizellomyces punctatus (strain DAOM BR117) TaxID=645134 RepID=A0A0L0H6Q5_SPIPD|nr:uncharacterized protein SPPG_07747 [Spizellomyces punctatus DAOM BR117]KNC96922.1 hypothetical protein SPPG_07747 [Spizellomyces punctatus DAOM BR117]|eukprot:XP_016604962.1 hypothetical protein SPPG_07747 [Spizellomyces punctatus DAOM BR117]